MPKTDTNRRWVLRGIGAVIGGGVVSNTASADEHENEGLPTEFAAELAGEAHGIETNASGRAYFEALKLLGSGVCVVRYTLVMDCIRDVTMAHIHVGGEGEDGPPVVWLYPEETEEPERIEGVFKGLLAAGSATIADFVGPFAGEQFATLHEAMTNAEVYVNVHTEQHPGGEIRGQIRPAEPFNRPNGEGRFNPTHIGIVRVVDTDGKPVAGEPVIAYGGSVLHAGLPLEPEGTLYETNDDGEVVVYSASPEPEEVAYMEIEVRNQREEFTVGRGRQTIEFTVSDQAAEKMDDPTHVGIVRVVNTDGEPVAGERVIAYGGDVTGFPDPDEDEGEIHETNDDGEVVVYSASPEPNEVARFVIEVPEASGANQREFYVGLGTHTIEFTIVEDEGPPAEEDDEAEEEEPPEHEFTLTAVDPDGNPVSGRVIIFDGDGDFVTDGALDENGQVVFSLVDTEFITDPPYVYYFYGLEGYERPSGVDTTFELTEDRTETIELQPVDTDEESEEENDEDESSGSLIDVPSCVSARLI